MQPYLSPDAASLADLLPAFLPLGLPLGLQLGVGLSLPLFSLPFALGCGDLVGGDLGPLVSGELASLGPLGCGDSVAWLACGDWLPPENGPKTFLKKSLARAEKAVSMYTSEAKTAKRNKQTQTE